MLAIPNSLTLPKTSKPPKIKLLCMCIRQNNLRHHLQHKGEQRQHSACVITKTKQNRTYTPTHTNFITLFHGFYKSKNKVVLGFLFCFLNQVKLYEHGLGGRDGYG